MVSTVVQPDTLTTTYLEMTSPSQFKPSFVHSDNIRIERLHSGDVNFYRFLYKAVGDKWCWRDRLYMSDAELQQMLHRPDVHVYVLFYNGSPAGYVELARSDETSVEIAYFGLREEFMGRGLGKHLLSFGIQQAWQMKPKRICVHTCNLDSPYALSNYQKRGFQVYMRHNEPMPERYLQ